MLKEEYFGCSCFDLNHISHFSLLDNEDFIFFSVKIEQWRNGLFPYACYVNEYFSKDFWKMYFNTSFFSRFIVSFNYLFKNKITENFIVDSLEFQEKDYSRLIGFLDNLKNNKEYHIDNENILLLIDEREEYYGMFYCKENCVKFEVYFCDKTIINKIKTCIKYIFNYKFNNQIEFKLIKDNVNILRSLLLATKENKIDR